MRKYLMYVVTLALSVAVAACTTKYQPQVITQETTGNRSQTAEQHRDEAITPPTEVPRTAVLPADALQRGRAAYDRQDYMTALREWLPLAQQGYAPAQNNLGVMYAKGQGVAQDAVEAVRWYRQAAAQGNAGAQTNLGFMYAEGRGVAQDDAEAVRLYRQATPQGNATAQNNLGWMYAEGRGVARDDAEAVRWYQKAAAQGNAYAYENLGQMYEQGRGVTRDLVEAQRWYAKAAEVFPPGPKRIAAIEARDRARQLATNQASTSMPSSVTSPAPVSVSPSPASLPVTPPVSAPATHPSTSLARVEEIPLAKVGGVYELPVEINGVLTLNFVLDSGASEVLIPADVVFTLVRTGTIKDTDFLPGKTYILADGSELRSPRFILRSLKIGTHQFTNIPASIGTLTSGLLLGQSLLEKLGTWGIDTQRKVLVVGALPSADKGRHPPVATITASAAQTVSRQATRAIIETKFGSMEIRFCPDKAPKHVENFIRLARARFYDNTIFHRVIPGFMIQGGDPNTKDEKDKSRYGMGGPSYSIKAEFNDRPHVRGAVSMARAQDPDSAGSQFFLMVKEAPALNGKYTIFGEVVMGIEVADRIVSQPRDARDNPLDRIEMRVRIIE